VSEDTVKEPVKLKTAVLIAGPTASGKSALAMKLAEQVGGEIVNADSMQVYRELRVLTARPDEADEARVPHHLYGFMSAAEACSAGIWAAHAARAMQEIEARGRVPILVGGTGLYFRALVDGLSPIPDVPAEITAAVRAEVAQAGPGAHKLLQAADPKLAEAIAPSDKQRIARGIEVKRATGKPLSAWQALPPEPLVAGDFLKAVLVPSRDFLYRRIDFRFRHMVREGALDEVEALMALDLDPSLPLMKALGLRPLMAHLRGEISLEEAVLLGQAESRRYAKRQETWFRTQMISWNRLIAQDLESLEASFFSLIDDFGLTGA
jgi:tRNA dimethylallyltransferase